MHGVCAQGRKPEHIAVQSARIEPKGRNRAPKARIAAGNRALKKTPKLAKALNHEQGGGMSFLNDRCISKPKHKISILIWFLIILY